jgi:hypothetical protein
MQTRRHRNLSECFSCLFFLFMNRAVFAEDFFAPRTDFLAMRESCRYNRDISLNTETNKADEKTNR